MCTSVRWAKASTTCPLPAGDGTGRGLSGWAMCGLARPHRQRAVPRAREASDRAVERGAGWLGREDSLGPLER